MSLVLVFGLALVPSGSAQAETIAQPMAACPTPHHTCAAACGTSCTYWTCEDNTTLPIAINQLPMTFIRAKAQCTERLEEVVINQLPLPQAQQSRMVDQVTRLPMAFAANSYACVSHTQAGPACTWQTGGWSTCSATCGGGTQTRSVTCSGAYCDLATKPATSQSCNTQACTWLPGGWSGCSATCGGGTQTRTVTCSGGTCDPATMPPTSQTCNINYCSWAASDWGACSASCGGGAQTRSVWCTGGSCDPALQPAASQACNTQACPLTGCTVETWVWDTAPCVDGWGNPAICAPGGHAENITLASGQSRVLYNPTQFSCENASYIVPTGLEVLGNVISCNNGVVSYQVAPPAGWYSGGMVWRNQKYQGTAGACGWGGSPLLIHMNVRPDVYLPLEFTSPLDGINFDLFGANAKPEPYSPVRISWYRQPEYYFIVLPNKKGEVKGIDELFGNNTKGPDGQFAKDGYWALAKYDGRSADGLSKIGEPDGYITVEDPVFAKLRYWHDDNFDGQVQVKELRTAEELGIELIDLAADESFKETDKYGNDTMLKSVVRTKDKRLHVMFDVWFYAYELKRFEALKKAGSDFIVRPDLGTKH